MDDDRVPCCQLDAARKVRKLYIKGEPVGISRLDHIIDNVLSLELHREEEIRNELLVQLKQYNYIPSGRENEYVSIASHLY